MIQNLAHYSSSHDPEPYFVSRLPGVSLILGASADSPCGLLQDCLLGARSLAFPGSASLSQQALLIENLISAFTALQLPLQFIRERYFTPKHKQTPFVQRANPFQDIVIRCVRYAFTNMPAFIGRVFFSKHVALPFLRFRMLRHGYLTAPLAWREVNAVSCISHLFMRRNCATR